MPAPVHATALVSDSPAVPDARPAASAVSFLDAARRPIAALEGARIDVSSRPLGWPAVLVEAGRNGPWEVDEITPAEHYVALNVGAAPLAVEVKGPRGVFRRELLAPGAVWVCPAGEPFTHRVAEASAFALLTIAPARFAALTADTADAADGADGAGGDAPGLRRAYNLASPPLEHVMRALVAEAEAGGPTGLAFADAPAMAAARQLRRIAGVERVAAPPRAHGGLAPAVRRRVLALLESRLADGVSVEALAREAGLSPAHFARAFRASVGRAPHQELLAMRLAHARRLLERPDAPLSQVALASGFSDQAHLTRLFRRAYGVTPGAVRQALTSAR